MSISENLKLLRKEANLTQKELAENLNIAQTTIASYENGTREPHIFSLIAYANYFKCSLDVIVGLEDYGGNDTLTAATPKEIELLTTYRSLNGKLKTILVDYCRLLKNSDLNN